MRSADLLFLRDEIVKQAIRFIHVYGGFGPLLDAVNAYEAAVKKDAEDK